jgi:hypothetical protein
VIGALARDFAKGAPHGHAKIAFILRLLRPVDAACRNSRDPEGHRGFNNAILAVAGSLADGLAAMYAEGTADGRPWNAACLHAHYAVAASRLCAARTDRAVVFFAVCPAGPAVAGPAGTRS